VSVFTGLLFAAPNGLCYNPLYSLTSVSFILLAQQKVGTPHFFAFWSQKVAGFLDYEERVYISL
jgi:hypothetical protein